MATYVLANGVTRLEIADEDDDCNTLAEVLAFYRDQLNIPDGATVTLNGTPAPLDTNINDGDEVAFTKAAGSKG